MTSYIIRCYYIDFNMKIEFLSLIFLLLANALIAYLNCSIMNLISEFNSIMNCYMKYYIH